MGICSRVARTVAASCYRPKLSRSVATLADTVPAEVRPRGRAEVGGGRLASYAALEERPLVRPWSRSAAPSA